jgi:predicted dehydrogenase
MSNIYITVSKKEVLRMKKIRAGIIGTGRGWLNARMLMTHAEVELFGMSSLDMKTLNKLSSEHEFLAIRDWKELVSGDDLDCIFVSVPNYLHEEMAIFALEAGKHVYVDYPMTTSTVSADRMIDAAKKAGKVLAPGLTNRWEPGDIVIKEHMSLIGRPVMASFIGHLGSSGWSHVAGGDWFSDPNKSGGAFRALSIHFVDSMRNLFGAVSWVDATDDTPRFSEARKTFFSGGTILLEFKNKACGIVQETYGFAHETSGCRFQVVGMEGLFEYFLWGWEFEHRYENNGGEDECFDSSVHLITKEGRKELSLSVLPREDHEKFKKHRIPYTREFVQAYLDVKDFIRAIIDNRPLTNSALDARGSIEVIEACYRSVREKRRVYIEKERKK